MLYASPKKKKGNATRERFIIHAAAARSPRMPEKVVWVLATTLGVLGVIVTEVVLAVEVEAEDLLQL